MARKFDVKRAIDLFKAHEEIRRKENISQVDPFEDTVKRELISEKFTILPSRDSNGAAIALFTARIHLPAHTTHQAVLKALVFQLDTALESADTQRNGLVFIYDMSQSRYPNFDYELSIKILTMLKGSYPARLKKVLIVTAPLWFKAPFKILRLFVREKLRDRVYTVSVNQLSLHIPMNALPQRLHGYLDLQHKEWLQKCLAALAGRNANIDNEIATYFDSMDNHNNILPELNMSGSMSSSIVSTPNGDDTSFLFSSDLESEGSKETIQEKHSDEDREKEVSVEKDATLRLSRTPLKDGRGQSPPCKRMSDTSPSQIMSDGNPPPPLPRKKRPMSSEIQVPVEEASIHKPETGGNTMKELVEIVKIKSRRGLIREYSYIKAEHPTGTFEISRSKPCLPKNRYTDVLCLDQTRVKLSPVEGEPASDYINANFVDGYKHKGAFISSQGPLPRTFTDFWRMIWEQQVLIIVMTTRTVERGRLKCGQYWPLEEETAEDHGDFIIINNGVDTRKDYTVTSLILQNVKTSDSRVVTHFQFTSWPDYGVPHSAVAFLDIMLHVRRHQAERTQEMGDAWTGHIEGPPIVVHCSAGIGRTGTFITMDISTKRIADIGTVEVQKTVRRIRTQRAFSIQMPDQYVFCHLALIEHAQREGLLGTVDLEGFDDSSSDSD
jgi:tyrosine-protein phosphatase non-receptor type 9